MDWSFLLHLLAAAVIGVGACAWARHRNQTAALARAFAMFAIVLGVANLLLVMARSFGSGGVQDFARFALTPATVAGAWVVGSALALAAASLVGAMSARAVRLAAIGASAYVAAAFAGFEIGKAVHDAEMRQFFAASGLPVWFMYCVMGVESVAAVAILFARTRPVAAAALAAVMTGAVGTHWHNGDPWSDSSDAIRMLLLAVSVCLFTISGRRRHASALASGR